MHSTVFIFEGVGERAVAAFFFVVVLDFREVLPVTRRPCYYRCYNLRDIEKSPAVVTKINHEIINAASFKKRIAGIYQRLDGGVDVGIKQHVSHAVPVGIGQDIFVLYRVHRYLPGGHCHRAFR